MRQTRSWPAEAEAEADGDAALDNLRQQIAAARERLGRQWGGCAPVNQR